MGRMIDRFLLFFYTIAFGIISSYLLYYGLLWIRNGKPSNIVVIPSELWLRNTMIIGAIVVLLISIRFLYISLRPAQGAAPSIDQKTNFGDIRISLATVENLSLRAAAKIKGVHDLKAKINVNHAGLQVLIRLVVDGDVSIPDLTEEVQRSVKEHLEETTGIPVADVSVFIANIVQTQTFKSRVE